MHLKLIVVAALSLFMATLSPGGNGGSSGVSTPTVTLTQDNEKGLGEAFAGIDAKILSEGLDRLDADLHPTPTPLPPTPEPQPVARASHTHSGSLPKSISIPRFGITASVVVKGIDANGAMETPEGPWESAWYDFTHKPGSSDGKGNAVFSGHVDALYTGQDAPAVFFHLKDLKDGDEIRVKMADGTTYKYAVSSKWAVDGRTGDVGPIVGRTEKEVITLITCGGGSGTNYNQRLIIRAERIE